MPFLECLLIGLSLAMDAFAVSLCRGLEMKRINYRHAVIVALFFGVFQALMPVLGWLLGRQFERYIMDYDHWVAFGLLAFLGCKMIYEVLRGGDEEEASGNGDHLDIRQLLIMAIATSVDALVVGLTFAFLGGGIVQPVLIIGVTTFLLCLLGVIIGNRFGARFRGKAELCGGIVLILIGLKILLEHLGVIAL